MKIIKKPKIGKTILSKAPVTCQYKLACELKKAAYIKIKETVPKYRMYISFFSIFFKNKLKKNINQIGYLKKAMIICLVINKILPTKLVREKSIKLFESLNKSRFNKFKLPFNL